MMLHLRTNLHLHFCLQLNAHFYKKSAKSSAMDMDLEMEEDDEEAEKVPKIPASVFLSEGIKYFRLNLFHKAISSFSSALEQQPKNVDCRVGRAHCYLNLGMISEAQRDLMEVADSKKPKVRSLAGEIEYFLGDFEKSLAEYERGVVARPNFEKVRLGRQSARKAIDNALRPDNQSIALQDADVMKMRLLLDESPPEKYQPRETRSRKYSEDLDFLQTLLSDEAMRTVHPDCRILMDYLKQRRDFWNRQQLTF